MSAGPAVTAPASCEMLTFFMATKKGTLNITSDVGVKGVLGDVLFCPEAPYNLMSVSKMQQAGYTVIFDQRGAQVICKDGNTVMQGVSEICFMTAPVGDCSYCCPRDDVVDIQYKLFTRLNPTNFQVIQPGDAAGLQRTVFDPGRPTVIYLMGFSEATTGPSTVSLRDAYLSRGDYNFISVDWSRLIAFPWYATAVRNTRYMGVRLADFVQFLEGVGVRAASLHVIGFSLGAEAAGFCGKELKRRGLMLGRITGLDPAYPGYSLTNSDGHLSKGDATFVDVLHTNPGIFGFPQPIGDVDFYPNPGSWIQPGCWFDQLVRSGALKYAYGCSHNRAWRLYAESVNNPQGFPATLCRDWKSSRRTCRFQLHGVMGFGAARPMAGKMYLETNERPPFAKNGP